MQTIGIREKLKEEVLQEKMGQGSSFKKTQNWRLPEIKKETAKILDRAAFIKLMMDPLFGIHHYKYSR